MPMKDDDSLEEKILLRKFILNQNIMLSDEKCKSMMVGDSDLAECRERKDMMMSIMMLLQTFLRMGSSSGYACGEWEIMNMGCVAIPETIGKILMSMKTLC